jgi:hypothetical protein
MRRTDKPALGKLLTLENSYEAANPMRVGSLERDQPISAGKTLKHKSGEYLQCFGAVGAGRTEVQEGS